MWTRHDYLATFLFTFGFGMITHSALLNNGDLPESPGSMRLLVALVALASVGVKSLAKDYFRSRIY